MATTALAAIDDSLIQIDGFLNVTSPSFARITVILTSISMLTNSIADKINPLEEVIKSLRALIDVAKVLGAAIPEVGPVIRQMANTIDATHIIQNLDRILGNMRKFLGKLQGGSVQKIQGAAQKLLSKEDALRKGLPGWITEINILLSLSKVIDQLVAYLPGTVNTYVQTIEKQLQRTFNDTSQPLMEIEGAFSSARTFVHQTWAPIEAKFNSTIDSVGPAIGKLDTLSTTIGAILKYVLPLQNAELQVTKKVVDTISDLGSEVWGFLRENISPITDVVDTVVDAAGNVVDKVTGVVLDVTGIGDKINDFINFLEHSTGLDVLEKAFGDEFVQSFENLTTSIENLVNDPKINAVEQDIGNFAKNLDKWRTEPGIALLDVIHQAFATTDGSRRQTDNNGRLKGRWMKKSSQVLWEPVSTLQLRRSLHKRNASTTIDMASSEAQIESVKKTQQRIDDFCSIGEIDMTSLDINSDVLNKRQSTSNTSLAAPVSVTIPRALVRAAPKLGYAYFDRQPVSVLMRLVQQPVLRDLRSTNSTSMSLVNATNNSMTDPNVTDPFSTLWFNVSQSSNSNNILSSNASLQLQNYFNLYAAVSVEIDKTSAYISGNNDTFQGADEQLAKNISGALDFADHLVALLDGLDPNLNATLSLLQLPLTNGTALIEGLPEFASSLGFTNESTSQLSSLVTFLGDADITLNRFFSEKELIKTSLLNMSSSYREACQNLSSIYTSTRFADVIGPATWDLSSLMALLQQWLSNVDQTFSFVGLVGGRVYRDQTEFAGDVRPVLSQLDLTIANLTTLLGVAKADIDSISAQVGKVHDQTLLLQEDFASFLQAVMNIYQQCRMIELKVIAAEQVRNLTANIVSVIGPFEGFLATLNNQSSANITSLPVDSTSNITTNSSQSPADISQSFTNIFAILSTLSPDGIQGLLQTFFDFNDTKAEISKLTAILESPVVPDLSIFDSNIEQLLQVVKPKSRTVFSLPVDPGPVRNVASPIIIYNTFLNDVAATSAQSALYNMVDTVQQLKYSDNTTIFGTPASQQADAQRDPTLQAIRTFFLLNSAQLWDKVQPNYPSIVFLQWYSSVDSFDRLVQGWPSANESSMQPSSAIKNASSLTLWRLLQDKINDAGSQYNATFVTPLLDPLQQRVNQLLRGTIELEGDLADRRDWLKILPAPQQSNSTSQTTYVVPEPARNILSSVFTNTTLPTELRNLLTSQADFEETASSLRLLLAGAASNGTTLPFSTQNCVQTLDLLHDSYNLMVAQQLLNATGDANKTREYVQLAGSGALLSGRR